MKGVSVMEILKEKLTNMIRISINGKIGNNTVDEFQDVVFESISEYDKVVLDFKNLVYMNSAGLRVLLVSMKNISHTDKKLIIRNVCSEIMELFKMTGFDDILVIE